MAKSAKSSARAASAAKRPRKSASVRVGGGKPPARGAPRSAAKSAPAAKSVPVAKSAPVAKAAAVRSRPAKPKPGAKPLSRTAQMAKEVAARRRLQEKKKADLAAVRPLGVLPPGAVRPVERRRATGVPPRPILRRAVPMPAPAASGEGLSETDMSELEAKLLQERRKIMKDMGHLENTVLKVNQRDSSGDLSGYSFHMADAGTDAMEREKAFLFASAEGRLLLEVNDALRRVYSRTYGICELCEKPISRARLDAMPYTRMCVSCKEKEERLGRSTPGQ